MDITRRISASEEAKACDELSLLGFTKIQSYLNPEVTAELLSLVNVSYDRVNRDGPVFYKGVPSRDQDDKIVYNLQNIDKIFLDILVTPLIRSISVKKLNDEYYRFLPSGVPNYTLLYYNARSSGQKLDLHIDSYIPFQGDRTYMMQCAFLLEESTIDNGCTTVVAGSHLTGKFSDRATQDVAPLTGNAGDLILWDSRLWHGTLSNLTGKSRWALIATLGMWWIKPSMDITRAMNEAIYKACSNEQKLLLGFCALPPVNPSERINTKCGYEFLKPSVVDYFRK